MADVSVSTGAFLPKDRRYAQTRHLCVLYVLAVGQDGPSKIGFTTDIMQRIRSLQTGNWQQIKAYDFRVALPKNMSGMWFDLEKFAVQGAKLAEIEAHRLLTEFDLRLMGEWFDVSPKDALAVIDKSANTCDFRSISLEQVAGAVTAMGLDPQVKVAQDRLVRSMAKIKMMAAAASQEAIDIQLGQ